MKTAPAPQRLALIIDLDERGWFKAHVENQSGKTVFELSNEDEETGWPSEDGFWLVEDGYCGMGAILTGFSII